MVTQVSCSLANARFKLTTVLFSHNFTVEAKPALKQLFI